MGKKGTASIDCNTAAGMINDVAEKLSVATTLFSNIYTGSRMFYESDDLAAYKTAVKIFQKAVEKLAGFDYIQGDDESGIPVSRDDMIAAEKGFRQMVEANVKKYSGNPGGNNKAVLNAIRSVHEKYLKDINEKFPWLFDDD